MRIGKSKSTLKKMLQKEVSIRHISNQITCMLVDGSAILYNVHWPLNGSVSDYLNSFRTYLERKLSEGDVYILSV